MFKKMKMFTGSSVKMLVTLALDPMRSFFQKELADEAGVSVGSASENLPQLVEQGLLLREKRGKVYIYRYNVESVVARQFKVFLNVVELQSLVDSLKNRTRRVILYGSAASGTDAKDSDMDLFLLTGDKEYTAKTINGYETERWLSPLVVDVNDLTLLRSRDAALYEEIQRGIVLWERE